MYKFNDSIESISAEKGLIRHTSKVKNKIGLQKLEEIFLAVFDRKNYNRKREKKSVHYRNRGGRGEGGGREGVKLILEIEDPIELLNLFELFYYFKGRFPLTNGLLPIPDGGTPDSSEKISIKTLYKIFKYTKSHGLVSLQFLLALNLIWRECLFVKRHDN